MEGLIRDLAPEISTPNDRVVKVHSGPNASMLCFKPELARAAHLVHGVGHRNSARASVNVAVTNGRDGTSEAVLKLRIPA
jgi:hypothetical protein